METSEFTFLRSGVWSAILSDRKQKSSNQSMFYGNQGLQGSFSKDVHHIEISTIVDDLISLH